MANTTSTATAFVMMLTLTAAVHAGSVLFVDDDAPPGGDGTTWDTAYRFLQDALTNASGGGVSEIRIAQGTYRPDKDEANPDGTADPEATFQLIDGVALAGGYAGLGEPDPDDHDIELYQTILSGSISPFNCELPSDCCFAHDTPGCSCELCEAMVCEIFLTCCTNTWEPICASFAAIVCSGLCRGSEGPQSFHVLSTFDASASILLDGLIVEAGSAQSPLPEEERIGGGLYNVGSTLTIINCTFLDNQAWESGGGIANIGGTLNTSNCLFVGNDAGFGGAIYNLGGSATITECEFRENAAGYRGGAIYNDACPASVTDCLFKTNEAFFTGGGGIYNLESAAQITRCTFDSNLGWKRGGGMFNEDCDPTVIDCTFVANRNEVSSHDAGGAGMYNDGSSPIVLNCNFIDNMASGEGGFDFRGGGMFNYVNSNPMIIDCNFVGNLAGSEDPPVSGSGGGVANSSSSPVVIGCLFDSNRATGWGGAMISTSADGLIVAGCEFVANTVVYQGGGAMYLATTNAIVTDCRFRLNKAKWGGAVAQIASDASSFTNCAFIANQSEESSGAAVVCWFDAVPIFDNCAFIGNKALVSNGGAVASWAPGSNPRLVNCTLAGNFSATSGGGIFVGPDGNGQGEDASATIVNSVLWNNFDQSGNGESAQVFVDDSSPDFTASVDYSCIEGLTGKLGGLGNIGDDPLFIDPDGDDNVPGNEDDDLRLQPGSPAIDAANNWGVPVDENDYDEDGVLCELFPVDLDANPRFNADEADFDPGCGVPVVVDMGAYEYQFDPTDQVTFADLNADGTVGAADLLGLLVSWGTSGKGCCLADLNIDGNVGASDLLALLANWGPCPG